MAEHSSRETRRQRRRAPRRSSRAIIALAALALAVVAVGAVWWLNASKGRQPVATPTAATASGASPATKSPTSSSTSGASASSSAAASSTVQDGTTGDISADTLAAEKASLQADAHAAVPFPGAPAISPTTPSLNHLSPKHKYIALTLDDGYNYQPALLALLKQYHVHCTTFLVGSWAASNISAVKAMNDAGFEIANHSWTHPFLTRLSSTQVASELTRTERVLTSVTGHQAPYLRPPFGDTNPSVKAAAARLGMRIVMWDRTFGDSGRGATPTKLYSNVVYSNGGVKAGDIILCHWGSKPSYQALKKVLPDLQAQGFQFVTVSELVADSK